MKTTAALLMSLSMLGTSVAYGNFAHNVSSYVNIQVPHNLKVNNTEGGIVHQRARFGAHWDLLRQEGHMTHQIHYVNGRLCGLPDHNTTKTFGAPPFLLLADEGGCTDVFKARLAQDLGAAGLIINSQKCLVNEGDECHSETDDRDNSLPPVWDDGSGATIVIPVMRIARGKAESIKKVLMHKQPVLMELAWHQPTHHHNLTIDFWHTPTHSVSQDFLTNFSVLADGFGEKIEVKPHHYILDGTSLNCGDTEVEGSHCHHMCTNKGRYCAVSHKEAKGKDVVVETLRRMCIHKNGGMEAYWAYVDHFNERCRTDEFFTNEKCLAEVYKHAKLKSEDIQQCMDDSGKIDEDITNSLLDMALVDSRLVIETPTLMINELPYTWPLTYTNGILEAMCSSFVDGFAPHICYTCLHCGDPVKCAARSPMKCDPHDGEKIEPKHRGDKKGGGHHVLRFLFFVAIIGGAGGYVYYKKYVEDGGDGLGSYTISTQLMSDAP